MADEPNNNVQLGCGTLIVIAIIVMIFSGRDETADVRRELDEVNARLGRARFGLRGLRSHPSRAGQRQDRVDQGAHHRLGHVRREVESLARVSLARHVAALTDGRRASWR